VTLNTVIDACARSGRLADAAQVLELTIARGLEPDRITFSTLVKGFCIAGEIEQAVAVMQSSRRRGLAPDVFMINTLMDHCTTLGRLQQVDEFYEQMLADGVRPTAFTLGVLIKRCGKEGKLDQAFEYAETLPKKYGFQPTTPEMTCLISACLMNKQLDRALAVYTSMRTRGPTPDPITFERLISGVLRLGSVEMAAELLRDAYGLRGPLGVAPSHKPASGTVTPGGSLSRVGHIDSKVVESVVEQLRAAGKNESVAIPLLQALRSAGAKIPSHLLTGAVRHATGATPAPWAKRR